MKTSELIGPALDWAVAKAAGAMFKEDSIGCIIALLDGKCLGGFRTKKSYGCALPSRGYYPSTDWSRGGPIIEREEMAVGPGGMTNAVRGVDNPEFKFRAFYLPAHAESDQYGPTPLIAAMRCYVASKLGDEVEVPEELQS